MRKQWWNVGVLGAILCAALVSCPVQYAPDVVDEPPLPPEDPPEYFAIDAAALSAGTEKGGIPGVYEFPPDNAAAIIIDKLSNNRVAFVHVNLDSQSLPMEGRIKNWTILTPSAPDKSPAAPAAAAADGQTAGAGLLRLEYAAAQNYAASHLPPAPPGKALSEDDYSVDSSARSFWIERASDKEWYQLSATLRYKSPHCFVWVPDANFAGGGCGDDDNKISSAQAFALGNKFNAVYQKETALLGFEWGGGPGGNGGIDGLKPVQILVYDIDEDYSPGQTAGVFGYFWSKDMVSQSNLEYEKTNQAEMIYLDCHILDKYPEYIYSTMIHEFQHLIAYSQKTLQRTVTFGTWYAELTALLAEDLLSEFVDISSESAVHPIQSRMPFCLSNYASYGANLWRGKTSYPAAYSFGAFLARNFGGAALVKEMMQNNFADEKSVVNAVNAVTGGAWTFRELLAKYSEAFVFSEKDGKHYTFNKTVSTDIDGVTYTFNAFDITKITRLRTDTAPEGAGPYFYKQQDVFTLSGSAFAVFSPPEWENVSGAMTLNLRKFYGESRLFIMIQ